MRFEKPRVKVPVFPWLLRGLDGFYLGSILEAMPIYEYRRRKDGSVFEIHQKMTDEPLTHCPTTGDAVDRIVSASAFHLKGSGWYTTDYKSNSAPETPKTEKSEETAAKPACQGGEVSCGQGACSKPASN